MVCFCYSRFSRSFAALLLGRWIVFSCTRHFRVRDSCAIHSILRFFFFSPYSFRSILSFHPSWFNPYSPFFSLTAVAVADLLQLRCVLLFLHSFIHSLVRSLTLTYVLFSFINLFINFSCFERLHIRDPSLSRFLYLSISRECVLCVCRCASISIICIAYNERVF